MRTRKPVSSPVAAGDATVTTATIAVQAHVHRRAMGTFPRALWPEAA
ncbi:MAG TPA: hypothetical protein VFQ51_19280 [Vicinamibacteria bacterium]|nr:hypothetical protein [Vicinamibacteria bacterium]